MNALPAGVRNPILWLVIGIPLATLVGGYLTLRVAYLSGQSDEVPDEVARTGQAQIVELSPDRAAARRGLRMSVRFDPVARRITATQAAGRPLPAKPIELQFVHPLRADEDRTIAMLRANAGWQADMPHMAVNDWRLVLTDADHEWRVIGRLPRHAESVTLQPSLPP